MFDPRAGGDPVRVGEGHSGIKVRGRVTARGIVYLIELYTFSLM